MRLLDALAFASVWVSLAAAALTAARPGERYGLLVVDGALLAGGLLALLGAPPGLAWSGAPGRHAPPGVLAPLPGGLYRLSLLGPGAVAQLGERRVRNAEVGGSIPLGSTTRPRRPACIPRPAGAGLPP